MTATQIPSGASAPATTYSQLPMACRLHCPGLPIEIEKDSSMETIDVACRIPRRREYSDHAIGGPLCRGIRTGRKGFGDALQDSAATRGEFIGGDVRRCDGGGRVVVVSRNWRG